MLASEIQSDFSAGMFRSPDLRKIPRNGLYELINGLIEDDGSISKRGGTEFATSADAGAALTDLWGGSTVMGSRVVAEVGSSLRYLNGTNLTQFYGSAVPHRGDAPSALGMMAFVTVLGSASGGGVPGFSSEYILWGGGTGASYNAGTITTTQGSTTVTGAGTAWNANASSGMVLYVSGVGAFPVSEVNTDTSLRLAQPWPTTAVAGSAYTLNAYATGSLLDFPSSPPSLAVAGNRLLWGSGNKIKFTNQNQLIVWTATDYHQLPEGTLVGLKGLGDSALVFSTAGVYRIDGFSLDLTDDFGNVQHTVRKLNTDLVLPTHSGSVAAFGGGFIVPAYDDVYVMAGDGQVEKISGAISDYYRFLIDGGFLPGYATVFKGHLFLPMVSGGSAYTTLVCRLASTAWSQWVGDCLTPGFVTSGQDLYTFKNVLNPNRKVIRATSCFEPEAAVKNDASGSEVYFNMITRAVAGHHRRESLFKKVSVVCDLTDAASDNPEMNVNLRDSAMTQTSVGAITERTSEAPQTLVVPGGGVRSQGCAVELTSTDPVAGFTVKQVDLQFRPSRKP